MTAYSLTSRSAADAVARAALPDAMQETTRRPPAAASQHPSPHSRFRALAVLAPLAVWLLAESWRIAASVIEQGEGGWVPAATALVVALSALISSIAGFAFSAIAGSALAYLHVEPVRAVQMMVVCSIATQCYAVWSIREAIRWRAILPMAGAGVATVPLGVWLLLHVDALYYAAGLGGFLAVYGCYLALRRDSSVAVAGIRYDMAAGALGGLVGGLAGIPGAPVTVWCSMRGWDKLTQRATYQPYILAMQMATLACLNWESPRQAIAHDLGLVPFALVGAIGGLAIFRRMSTRQFQIAVSVLLLVSGLGLLARAL